MSESAAAPASPSTFSRAPMQSPTAPPRLAKNVGSLAGSEILRIAAEIRKRREAGEAVVDFTVGDFDPKQFRIPALLEQFIADALHAGETNYPPSVGLPVLREAVSEFYERELGLRYAADEVLVTCGSRPGLYGAYRTLVDPGDRVVYGVPSWNNNYYCHLVGAVEVQVRCGPDTNFLPTASLLAPVLRHARLLALNSPINPTGAAFDAETLGGICDAVLEENSRRVRAGERALFVVYDQVYWMLTFGGVRHVDPVSLRAEMAPYTIYVDGISKAFAATGVRVGWVAGPQDIVAPMNTFLQHVGTWAPRAEQIATAKFLRAAEAVSEYRASIVDRLQQRLGALSDGLDAMRADGLPVESTPPMGAMYLSARFAINGRHVDGRDLRTNDDVRRYLLERAGFGAVPFQGFGVADESGWFRLSVGAVSPESISAMLPRLRNAIIAAG